MRRERWQARRPRHIPLARIPPTLLTHLRSTFALDWRGIHGASHWARVAGIGERLALENGARLDVVRLFAFFHDSRRIDDGFDPMHGHRGAELAITLRGTHYEIDQAGLDLLVEACRGHSEGGTTREVTIQTCWDADRLDLGRVGIVPDARFLGTAAARRPEVIRWAYEWSTRVMRTAP